MLLKKTIPKPILKLLDQRGISRASVDLCTDADLDFLGRYAEQWVVIARDQVLVFELNREGAQLLRDFAVKDITEVYTDGRVGSSFLQVEIAGVRREVVRYTNTHAEKFSKIAKKLRDLAKGREIFISPEDEKDIRRCPECGRMLPEAGSVCPACIKKGAMMARLFRLMSAYWYIALAVVIFMFAGMGLQLFMPQLTRVLINSVLTESKAPAGENVSASPADAKGSEAPVAAPAESGAATPAAPAEGVAAAPPTAEGAGAATALAEKSAEKGKEEPPGWFRGLVHISQPLRERFFQGHPKLGLLAIIVFMLALTQLLGAGLAMINARLATRISTRITFDMRARIFARLQQLSVRYYDQNQVGSLMTRVAYDVESFGSFIWQITHGILRNMILMVAAAAIIFVMNPELALYTLIPAPFVLCSAYVYVRYVMPRYHRFWDTRSKLANVLFACLSGTRVVKAFAQEGREEDRIGSYSDRFRQARMRLDIASGTFSPVAGYVFGLGGLIVWYIGGRDVLSGKMLLGDLIAFFSYLGMLYEPMGNLTNLSQWITDLSTQAHRVFEVLDTEPEIQETEGAVAMKMRGSVEFDHVMFGYDRYTPVLHDVCLSIKEGEMIGLVGHSGSGKSTFVTLLCRFYDPLEGSIRIDGVDLRQIRVKDVRGQIGLVLQEPFLFRGTIAENIAYGKPEAKPEEVLEASRAANAHDFITRFHDSYDTRLGESGSGLSGGERQRVSIARALLYNPRILILDEATSSVDTVTEREIQKALDVLVKGRTTIAAAHRLSTLQNCDRIVVFEDGHIRELGTHEELMALNGIYHRMVTIQTQLTKNKESIDELSEEAKVQTAEQKDKGRDKDKGKDQDKAKEAAPAKK